MFLVYRDPKGSTMQILGENFLFIEQRALLPQKNVRASTTIMLMDVLIQTVHSTRFIHSNCVTVRVILGTRMLKSHPAFSCAYAKSIVGFLQFGNLFLPECLTKPGHGF
jgi:hypothetical protein